MKRFAASALVLLAVGLYLMMQSDPHPPPEPTDAPVKHHPASAPSAADAERSREDATSTALLDQTTQAGQPRQPRPGDPPPQAREEFIASLKIGSDEFGAILPPELSEDLRAYIMEDLSRILPRAVGAEVERTDDRVVSSGGREINVQGRLEVTSLPRDVQVYAIGDRLRDVISSSGRWEVVVPDSLIERYREVREFWNEVQEFGYVRVPRLHLRDRR